MRQPAHNNFVGRDHLLAVNTKILAWLVGAAGNHQPPANQWCDISWPAGLYGQLAQVYFAAFPYDFLTGSARNYLGRHIQYLLQYRPFAPGIFQTFGRLGFFQVSQQFTHFAQRCYAFLAHTQCHAVRCAEQIRQNRYIVSCRILKQHSRTLCMQHAVADFRHLQIGRN